MTISGRVSAWISLLGATALTFAQEKTEKSTVTNSHNYVTSFGLISWSWWLLLIAISAVLAILLGYFVYAKQVSSGRAGAATGCGCLVSVVTFFVALLASIFILVVTVFSLPVQGSSQSKSEKSTTTTSKPTSTSAGSTATTGDEF